MIKIRKKFFLKRKVREGYFYSDIDEEKEGKNLNLEEHVVFSLNDELYSFKSDELIEVLKDRQILDVPFSSDSIAGIINHRGEIITIFDLKKVLNLDTSDTLTNNILLSEDNEEKIGFLIDSVQNIIEVPTSMIQSSPVETGNFSERYSKGQFRLHDCPVIILNQGKILSMNVKTNYEELGI